MERPEFVPLFTDVLAHEDCTQLDAIVYGYIYWFTKLRNERCIASNETLAQLAGCKSGSIENSLTSLEDAGFIERVFIEDNRHKGRLEIIPMLSVNKRPPTNGRGSHPRMGDRPPRIGQSESIEGEHIFVAPPKKAVATPKKSSFGGYDENTHSDDGLPSIGDEDVLPPAPQPNMTKAYQAMLRWAEERRGFGFGSGANIKKQYKAFKMARDLGIEPGQLKERWGEMETDDFWSKAGFDWMNVVDSLQKRR